MKFIAAMLLASAAMPAVAATNLVTNGSFESGFAGWHSFGNTLFNGTISGPALGQSPTDGTAQAYFGPVLFSGGIFQSVGTVAGESYRISFDLFAAPGGSRFQADFGGATLLNSSFNAGLGYTSFAYDVVATAASAQLLFSAVHNPSYYLLDNVRVEQLQPAGAVPEPKSWAMLIAGFGLVGASLRRRSPAVA